MDWGSGYVLMGMYLNSAFPIKVILKAASPRHGPRSVQPIKRSLILHSAHSILVADFGSGPNHVLMARRRPHVVNT